MGLLAQTITLHNWRNFNEAEFELSPRMTVLLGKNAVGKTNLIEALQLLTSGSSFRRPRPAQLIREGASRASAELSLGGDGRVIEIRCDVDDSTRRFIRNGKHVRPASLPQTLMSILFTPDDLTLVKGGASKRRDALDGFGRQVNQAYGRLLSRYMRAVEQRNRLLREPYPDLSLLDAWDASVASGAGALLHARLRLFDRLRSELCEVYPRISRSEHLECQYVSSFNEDISSMSRDEITSAMVRRLNEGRQDDLRRQQTLVGPQRDDISFTLDGRDARSYASQGQQRSIVLAWKMAEVGLSRQLLNEQPLLLLDDVMSELDESRRSSLTEFVQEGMQTVVTTTNLGYFPEDLLHDGEVVRVGG